MALDVSMWILLLNLVLAQLLGILNVSWMPCSCLATPSCSLFHHLQVINLIIMVDLDLRLGYLLLLNLWFWLRFLLLHQLLGGAYCGEVTPSAALEAFDMFKLLFFLL